MEKNNIKINIYIIITLIILIVEFFLNFQKKPRTFNNYKIELSIVVPVYNVERYILACLNSLTK